MGVNWQTQHCCEVACGERWDGESSSIPGVDRHREKLERLPARCFQRERKRASSTHSIRCAGRQRLLWGSFRSRRDHLWQAVSKSLRRCPVSLAFTSLHNDPFSVWTGRSNELSLLQLGSKKTRAFVSRALSRPLLGNHDGTAQVSSDTPAGQVDTSTTASVRDPEPEPPSSAHRNQL